MRQYDIENCKSKLDFLDENSDWQKKINSYTDAKAVVWYYDEIVFYSIEKGKWSKGLKGIDEVVRLRIFNKDNELHIWRSNGVLKGRLREDTAGKDTEYVQTNQILNGTKFKDKETGILATEEKGINYDLPYGELKGAKDDDRIALVTRNYIGYTGIDQAGYIDCRFVDFKIVNSTKS
jgi:CRISPR-associated protein (TIGR03984 family)